MIPVIHTFFGEDQQYIIFLEACTFYHQGRCREWASMGACALVLVLRAWTTSTIARFLLKSSSSWSRWCQKWSIKQRSQTNLNSSTTLISRCLTAPQSLADQNQAVLTLTSLAPMTAGDVDQWRCWFKWNNCFCHLDEYCIVMIKWSLFNIYSDDPQEAWGQLLLVPAGRWQTLGLLLSSSRLSELVRSSLRSSWFGLGLSSKYPFKIFKWFFEIFVLGFHSSSSLLQFHEIFI